jgi:AraC-like DNA-binding protein
MVSIRCTMFVRSELEKMGYADCNVKLGEVVCLNDLSSAQLDHLKEVLHDAGLDVLDNKKSILIERIKNVVIEMVHYLDEFPKTKFSYYLSEKLNYDYTYLSNLFSETEGRTLEHFVLHHKVEKIKELIMYDELNLTEIAFKMHYSSVAHLSNQFKKITGQSPSAFKSMHNRSRLNLEDV